MSDMHTCPTCDASVDYDAQYCYQCGHALAVTGKTVVLTSPEPPTHPQIRLSAQLFFRLIVLIVSGWVVAGVVLMRELVDPHATQPQALTIATPYVAATALPHVLIPTRSGSISYLELNVQPYPSFTLYWKLDLWERALSTATSIEDFDLDTADYGEVSFPYLTGHGLLLQGQSSAQILDDTSLLGTGTMLHFRDWKEGLHIQFPDNQPIQAFGFDYRSNETWQLQVKETIIPLPQGRKGFFGFVCHEQCPSNFILVGPSGAQGGLSIDNIRFVPLTPST